jgi:hypothetical protein
MKLVYVTTTITICGVKTECSKLKHTKPIKNTSHYSGFFELASSLLVREIQIREMSKPGWQIRWVKHAI